MLNYFRSLSRGLAGYRRCGIGGLLYNRGGLLRYEIEERVAIQSDTLIASAFQRRFGDSSFPRDDLLHFMVFARNIHFFFLQPHFTRSVVLRARLSQNNARVDPKDPGAVVSQLITTLMCFQIGARIVASMLTPRKPHPSLQEASESTDGATIVVANFIGVSPNYRNDMFWLTQNTAAKVGKVVLLVRNSKDLEAATSQRKELHAAWSQKNIEIPKIVIASLTSAVVPSMLSAIRKSFELKIDTAKTKFLERCLLRIFHLYYARYRDAYAYFLEESQAVAITNTNLSFINAAISGAALRTSSRSIFRERSVWGNWSSVHRNKVICDYFSALSSTSKAYLEESNPHITSIGEQGVQTLPHSALREPQAPTDETAFRVLLLGSNISKNKDIFPPQVIPECFAVPEIRSFSKWAMKQGDFLVRIKEKKDGPGARSVRSIVLECTDELVDETFSNWEETARITPHQFASEIDLAIAIGTFYPSALHELTSILPKERCLFWDMTGLTLRYPSICDVAPIAVARSLEEVQAHIARLKASETAPKMADSSGGSGSFETWLLDMLEKSPVRSNDKKT